MSFTDLLRNARNTPVSVLHRFLTNFDPRSKRVYAFVEGEPDQVFYRRHIEPFGITAKDLFIYNCDGKANVYKAYSDVVSRYPTCTRTLFFVDKDVDDIIGRQWPTDPRIFVTQVYSIENYIVCREAMRRYFDDFVKLRRLDISLNPALDRFEQELAIFQNLMRPIMAWIVFIRRSGYTPNLNNINLGDLYRVDDAGVKRRREVNRFQYIKTMTQVKDSKPVWRQVRSICFELKRMPSKRFVRGKFEAWFFVSAGTRIADGLRKVSTESGASVGFSAQLTPSSFIQLLSAAVPAPTELAAFLRFHLSSEDDVIKTERSRSQQLLRQGISVVSRLLK